MIGSSLKRCQVLDIYSFLMDGMTHHEKEKKGNCMLQERLSERYGDIDVLNNDDDADTR